MNKLYLSIIALLPLLPLQGQPHLIGYLKNWQSASTPFLQIQEADDRYDYLIIAFALPTEDTDYNMGFLPAVLSEAEFLNQVHAVQDQGKKVLLSIGGATAPIILDSQSERDTFINSTLNLLYQYDFDGLDIDLEGGSLSLSGGTIYNPIDAPIIYLTDALRTIMEEFRAVTGQKMILTITPETAYVQGGQSAYNGVWGAYLPLIHALRDSIDILQVQLYNSGSMYGIDGNIYYQGTADFVLSQTEAVIQGFITAGGVFQGLPANKIAVGLPACPDAAGGGYLAGEDLKAAMRYLLGQGPQVGAYTLVQAGGYPELGGMMCWSINWDAEESCGDYYGYADVFEEVFEFIIATEEARAFAKCYKLFPNPTSGLLYVESCDTPQTPLGSIRLFDLLGRPVLNKECNNSNTEISVAHLPKGMYWISIGKQRKIFIKQ